MVQKMLTHNGGSVDAGNVLATGIGRLKLHMPALQIMSSFIGTKAHLHLQIKIQITDCNEAKATIRQSLSKSCCPHEVSKHFTAVAMNTIKFIGFIYMKTINI